MALGNGGIKPCVSSLGGDQFTGQEWVYMALYTTSGSFPV